jgi:hypothetical protein
VTVDGELLTERLDGKPLEIDPGPRALRYEAKGEAIADTVTIRQGEKNRMVDVRFQNLNRAATPAVREDRKDQEEEGGATIPTSSFVIGGAGLVLGAVGAALWLVGRSERSELYDTCGLSRACSERDTDGAKTLLVLGDVAVVSGAVALAIAIGLAIFARPAPRAASR